MNDAEERLEQLIKEHLERNPRIAEPDGVDMEFRDAVRLDFGILYKKNKQACGGVQRGVEHDIVNYGLGDVENHRKEAFRFYNLPGGKSKTRNCSTKGVMETLRDILKEKIASVGCTKRDDTLGKRKLDEDASTTAGTDSDRFQVEGAKLRRKVHELERENADLNWMTRDFLGRIRRLEMEKTAALDRAVKSENKLENYMEERGIVDVEQVDDLEEEIHNLQEELAAKMSALEHKDKECQQLYDELNQLRYSESTANWQLREEVRCLKKKLLKADRGQLKYGNESMSVLERRHLERVVSLLDEAKLHAMAGLKETEVMNTEIKDEPEEDDIIDAQLAT